MSHPAESTVDVPGIRRLANGWNVLIFLVALAAFEGVVDRVASPFQNAEKVEKKFAYFAAHKDDYDFVFVGSSRVMNQLSPKVFDAQMAAAGRPCRSFNLGVAAMFLPECSFLIDQIRALHPARLRGMVIELSSPAPRHDADDPLTERDIYWHRFNPTVLACAATWLDPESRATTPERLAQVALQTSVFARCLVHLGAGLPWLQRVRHRRDTLDAARELVGPASDGFEPLDHTLGQGRAGVAKTGGSIPDLRVFQANVATLRGARPAPTASCVQQIARDRLRAILAHHAAGLQRDGVRPFFFIGPGTTREQLFLDLHAEGILPTLLAFNDPDAHPDLYALDVRADRNHLNAAGAERLSRQLATAVASAER